MPPTDRVLPQRVIAENERGHCFDNWHGSWKNARIMPSAGSKLSLLVRSGDGFLLERNRCRRLKRNAKVNVFAIANATLHASGVVRGCPNSSSAGFECIVVLRTPHLRRRKSRADLKTFCRWYAQHRFRQVCFELVEHGLAKSGWDAPRHTLDYTADGIACVPNLLDQRYHLFRSGSIRAADNIFLNVVHRHSGTVNLRSHFVDLSHVSHEFEVRVQRGQCFLCNRARRDATDRFTRRRATAALPVSNSVFGFVSVIGMRRSKFARDFAVVFGSSVFVPNKNGDRRPERSALKNAGQKFALVFLFALGRQFALTGATTIKLSLNLRFGNFDAWRTTIDHHADAASMGLAKCGDAKQLAKCVGHWNGKLKRGAPNLQGVCVKRRRLAQPPYNSDCFQCAL